MTPEGDAAVTLRSVLTIVNERGLHARAAAKFVECAEAHGAEIWVSRLDMRVSGRSIMGLMMLAAGLGCEIVVEANGAGAAAAMAAITALVGGGFEEV